MFLSHISPLLRVLILISMPIFFSTCDEIKAPCDEQFSADNILPIRNDNIVSTRVENGWRVFQYYWKDAILLNVCMSRTINYSCEIERRADAEFTVLPEARLIWRYPLPQPSKQLLQGSGDYQTLFLVGAKVTTISKDRISLPYNDESTFGLFSPGLEIKFPTLGNYSDDYNYMENHFISYISTKVDYHLAF